MVRKIGYDPQGGVEVISPAGSELCESPVWDRNGDRLLWVDVPSGVVHSWDGQKARVAYAHGDEITCVRLTHDEDLLLTDESGIGIVWNGTFQRIARLVEPPLRMNDGACDARGRFWVGSMRRGGKGREGCLWSVSPEGETNTQRRGIGISNGIAWSPEGNVLYHVDSGTRCLYRIEFDLESARLGSAQVLARWQAPHMPDGITVDASGAIWVAIWDGFRVERLTPDGRVDVAVDLPAPRVTACTFGGSDASVLYVTTARAGLDAQSLATYPLSGSVFAVNLPVDQWGSPTHKFHNRLPGSLTSI